MKNDAYFLDALRRTRILTSPKHAISTFGTTTLRYILLSSLPDRPDYCRVRAGDVTAQRPKIMTPEFWKNRFEGFGDDANDYREEIEKVYGESLKGLEYTFRNDLKTTSLEHATLAEVEDRSRKIIEAEGATRTALLEGPDAQWSLSIMKFIIDMSLRSFPSNVKELDERGLFQPEKLRENRTRREIETLFTHAKTDRSTIPKLAEMLQQTGLFADFEDRFFSLVRS